MSVLVDKDGLPARSPGERTDTDAPSGVDPVHLHGPPVAPGDRVQESERDTTSFGPQFKEALHDFMKTWRAPEPRELGSRDEEAQPSAPVALPVWVQLMNPSYSRRRRRPRRNLGSEAVFVGSRRGQDRHPLGEAAPAAPIAEIPGHCARSRRPVAPDRE